jgi:zinc transporter ZupT
VLFHSLMAALGLALVHVFAGRLRFLDGVPRSRWLSLAGGVSVAYVCVHLLPEVAAGSEAIRRAAGVPFAFIESHAFLILLMGLVIFYGLERTAELNRRRGAQPGEKDDEAATSSGVFWLHIASFSLYNALVGYLLLHRREGGALSLWLFFAAMALHSVVNDYGLREHHKKRYTKAGRWMLAAAVLMGWASGLAIEMSEAAVAVLLAFLAGGVILNVFKEELPEERRSRFWAFAAGAALYGALLLSV